MLRLIFCFQTQKALFFPPWNLSVLYFSHSLCFFLSNFSFHNLELLSITIHSSLISFIIYVFLINYLWFTVDLTVRFGVFLAEVVPSPKWIMALGTFGKLYLKPFQTPLDINLNGRQDWSQLWLSRFTLMIVLFLSTEVAPFPSLPIHKGWERSRKGQSRIWRET